MNRRGWSRPPLWQLVARLVAETLTLLALFVGLPVFILLTYAAMHPEWGR